VMGSGSQAWVMVCQMRHTGFGPVMCEVARSSRVSPAVYINRNRPLLAALLSQPLLFRHRAQICTLVV
jgi:hypothetical protein